MLTNEQLDKFTPGRLLSMAELEDLVSQARECLRLRDERQMWNRVRASGGLLQNLVRNKARREEQREAANMVLHAVSDAIDFIEQLETQTKETT